jgi:hypothetical protein
MTWLMENSNIIMIVLMTVLAGLLTVVVGHLRTLIEATAYVAKLYEISAPVQMAEDLREIKENTVIIKLGINNIDTNTSD